MATVAKNKYWGRFDQFNFGVNSNIPANSGNTTSTMFSPKFSLILGPFYQTEYFINWGQGFHSNDARGTTITVDPTNAVTAVRSVPGLVKTGVEPKLIITESSVGVPQSGCVTLTFQVPD